MSLPAEKVSAVTTQAILNAVAYHFDCSIADMTGPSRQREYVQARQAAAILLRDLLEMPLTHIGTVLGNRDHTTIMWAVDRRSHLLMDDHWARCFSDALSELQGRPINAVELAPFQTLDRYPVEILEADTRTARVRFIGGAPPEWPGRDSVVTVNRSALKPAPLLQSATDRLEAYCRWAKPLVAEGLAPPSVQASYGRAQHALDVLHNKLPIRPLPRAITPIRENDDADD